MATDGMPPERHDMRRSVSNRTDDNAMNLDELSAAKEANTVKNELERLKKVNAALTEEISNLKDNLSVSKKERIDIEQAMIVLRVNMDEQNKESAQRCLKVDEILTLIQSELEAPSVTPAELMTSEDHHSQETRLSAASSK